MVINFFGRRGSGKTTAIRGNLKYCRSPVVIVDVLGNYNDPGFIQTENIAQCIQEIKKYYEKSEELENSPPTIINLKTFSPTIAADYISACIWEINGGTLVLDEVDSIDIPDGSCFDQYIRYGRNHYGDLITGCRRPAEIDRNLTAAANKFYCFETHEYRDIEYFRASVFGERAEELMSCPKYSGMFRDYDQGIIGKFQIDIQGNIYHTETSFT